MCEWIDEGNVSVREDGWSDGELSMRRVGRTKYAVNRWRTGLSISAKVINNEHSGSEMLSERLWLRLRDDGNPNCRTDWHTVTNSWRTDTRIAPSSRSYGSKNDTVARDEINERQWGTVHEWKQWRKIRESNFARRWLECCAFYQMPCLLRFRAIRLNETRAVICKSIYPSWRKHC